MTSLFAAPVSGDTTQFTLNNRPSSHNSVAGGYARDFIQFRQWTWLASVGCAESKRQSGYGWMKVVRG